MAPEREEIGYRPEQIVPDLVDQLRAFLGTTAFEGLCRDWVVRANLQSALPFQAQSMGSHWGRGVTLDVVALNWKAKAVLLGEYHWGQGAVERDVVRNTAATHTARSAAGTGKAKRLVTWAMRICS